MCGHNVSFEELKGLLEWQMIRGVTVFCPHLQGYSLRGIRKRDYPPAMYFQQPWWEEYRVFVEALSRTGMLLGEGRVCCDTLVIHPQTYVWTLFDAGENRGIAQLQKKLEQVFALLDRRHVPFHLGDETLIQRHGSVEGEAFVIGQQKYARVLLLNKEALFDNTKKLLQQYVAAGGEFIDLSGIGGKECGKEMESEWEAAFSRIPKNNLIDNENILYAARDYPEYILHYFVNPSRQPQTARINRGDRKIDPVTGKTEDFCGFHAFEPMGSLLVLEKKEKILPLPERWKLKRRTDNALLLDFCEYYFDSTLQEKNGYVLNIQNRACREKRPLTVRQVYRVEADFLPERLFLGCETPEIFKIAVNGVGINQEDAGFFVDRSIRLMDIHSRWKKGLNVIELTTLFRQPSELYENLEKAAVFESEKNKITYETEIEPVYLVGDFGVRTPGNFKNAERQAVKYDGSFILTEPATLLRTQHLEKQGYPFFCGTMELMGSFCAEGKGRNYRLSFDKSGINVISIRINDGKETLFLWGKKMLDITPWIKEGENTVHLTVRNNLRNLLGPHHLREGESYTVSPGSFFQEPCIWKEDADKTWDAAYCFAVTGLEMELLVSADSTFPAQLPG